MVALKVFIVVFLVLLLLLVTPAIGQNQTHPFAPDVIQDDGDGDGYSTCDDPILLVKVQCPVGWELDEEEDSISFNNASDYTYIIIERQHIFPIDNTADYMRDFLNSQRENGRVEIIDMSETSINGKEAHSSEYTSGGGSFKTIAYFVIDTGEYLGYIIRLISNPEAFDKYVPTFERIATSFEITDTKSEVPEPPGVLKSLIDRNLLREVKENYGGVEMASYESTDLMRSKSPQFTKYKMSDVDMVLRGDD